MAQNKKKKNLKKYERKLKDNIKSVYIKKEKNETT